MGARTYRMMLYGKKGCSKCARLKERIQKLLGEEQWRDFELGYCDISTEDGLVAFVERECLNPQRIPSVLVEKWDEAADCYRPLSNPEHRREAAGIRPLRYLGLQTDYSEVGKGVIPPNALLNVMKQARAL